MFVTQNSFSEILPDVALQQLHNQRRDHCVSSQHEYYLQETSAKLIVNMNVFKKRNINCR
jgi:hypothetical protein